MSSILEREFVLDDLQIFKEYDSSHFISNAKSALTSTAEPVNLNINFDYYSNAIRKSMSSLEKITLSSENIKSFLSRYNNLGRLDESNIFIKDIVPCNNIRFKPQYLRQYSDMIQGVIDKAVRGEVTNDDVIAYTTSTLSDKAQKQVVSCDFDYPMTAVDIVKKNTVGVIKADTNYIKTKVLPFVNNFSSIKEETLRSSDEIATAISNIEKDIKVMISAINKMKVNGVIDSDKLIKVNQISYNAIRGLMSTISYTSFMAIQKINNVINNATACNSIYTDLTNLYSDDNFIENAFDTTVLATDTNSLADALVHGDASAYINLSKQISEFYSGLPSVDNIELNDRSNPEEVAQEPYDKSAYEDIGKAYLEISAGLNIMASEGDEYLMVFDDIIKKSGFAIVLVERFRNQINKISDLSLYRGTENVSMNGAPDYHMKKRIISELNDYDDNMTAIAGIISNSYKKIEVLMDRYINKNNGEYTDVQTINELKVFLKDLKEQFQEMTKSVAANFYIRLTELAKIVESIDKQKEAVHINEVLDIDLSESAIDYVELAFLESVNDFEESSKEYFNALEASYFIEKELLLRGENIILEADDANTNGNTNNNNNQKNNTKVSVVDNSSDSAAKSGLGKIKAKIGLFIRNTVDRFMNFVGKSATKNTKWLATNKEELSNRSYNNVTVNILPYTNMSSDAIIEDIKKLRTNVQGLNAQTLNTCNDKNAVYQKLFPFISGGINESNGTLAEQITKYYKVGSAPLEVKPISNGQLKTEITTVMIPFCEQYPEQYKDRINKELTDLGKYADETLKAMGAAPADENQNQQPQQTQEPKQQQTQPATTDQNNNQTGQANATETKQESVSIFTEADENNSEPGLKDKVQWATEAIRYFTGSVLNAIRDRNADYLKVLSSLVPKTPVAPAQNTNTNNTETDNQDYNNTDETQTGTDNTATATA